MVHQSSDIDPYAIVDHCLSFRTVLIEIVMATYRLCTPMSDKIREDHVKLLLIIAGFWK